MHETNNMHNYKKALLNFNSSCKPVEGNCNRKPYPVCKWRRRTRYPLLVLQSESVDNSLEAVDQDKLNRFC